MPNTIDTAKIGKLGFGYMRLPRIGDKFDIQQINKMADVFLESGGTYFDTAHIYTGSEVVLRESVVERYKRDREKFQIATKLSLFSVNAHEDLEKQFRISFDRLGADYFDFYLLHGLNAKGSQKAEDVGAWDFFRELKEKGLIKHLGFSFHGTPEDLEIILSKHPETEFVQLQLNYLDWTSPETQSRLLHRIACKHKTPIVVMEPLRGGLLASESSPAASFLQEADPKASIASWALRFTASLEGVFVTLSGMSSLKQMMDNIATYADLKPLTDDEITFIDRAVELINAVPRVDCTDCKYCIDVCPSKIPIPTIIDLYNEYSVYKTIEGLDRIYWLVTRNTARAEACTACKECEDICPQNLDVSDTLVKASAAFDATPYYG